MTATTCDPDSPAPALEGRFRSGAALEPWRRLGSHAVDDGGCRDGVEQVDRRGVTSSRTRWSASVPGRAVTAVRRRPSRVRRCRVTLASDNPLRTTRCWSLARCGDGPRRSSRPRRTGSIRASGSSISRTEARPPASGPPPPRGAHPRRGARPAGKEVVEYEDAAVRRDPCARARRRRSAKPRPPHTSRCGWRLACWSIMAMLRSRDGAVVTSTLSRRSVPSSIRWTPAIARSSVVSPEPEG